MENLFVGMLNLVVRVITEGKMGLRALSTALARMTKLEESLICRTAGKRHNKRTSRDYEIIRTAWAESSNYARRRRLGRIQDAANAKRYQQLRGVSCVAVKTYGEHFCEPKNDRLTTVHHTEESTCVLEAARACVIVRK